MPSPIEILSDYLARGVFTSRIDPTAVATPSLYDMEYNAAVIACALSALGKEQPETKHIALNASILKFASFIAARPILLADFETWHDKTRHIKGFDLESWPHLPRGFLTDRTHVGAVDFLAATGHLLRVGSSVELPQKSPLRALLSTLLQADLFRSERAVVARLKDLRVTQTMLGVAP